MEQWLKLVKKLWQLFFLDINSNSYLSLKSEAELLMLKFTNSYTAISTDLFNTFANANKSGNLNCEKYMDIFIIIYNCVSPIRAPLTHFSPMSHFYTP